jgi:predicted RND superfamily exporter protein
MIGVGIDYTIHFLWRYKEERADGQDYIDAVKRTITTTGRGITFNALSVIIGFSVLLLSNFTPIRFFGFLVFVSILACLVGAMILIPAILLVFKPRFLEPKNG